MSLNQYAAARAAYNESSALTATPQQLVVMLYDGAIRFFYSAAAAARQGNRPVARDRLRRAQAIITELNNTLDMGQGQVSRNLRNLYAFSSRHLINATLNNDPDGYEQVAKLLAELRGAWAQSEPAVEAIPA